jgi:thiol-disulfide isomerase/thioredoxin
MRRLFLAFGVLSSVILLNSFLTARSDKGPTILVFTANWCASCREVMPAVQGLVSQKGFLMQLVDVDQEVAVKLAKDYGLTLNRLDPPRVYYISPGKPPVLLLDESSDITQAGTLMLQKLPK